MFRQNFSLNINLKFIIHFTEIVLIDELDDYPLEL